MSEHKREQQPGQRSVRSFVMRRARMNKLHRSAIERLSPVYVLQPSPDGARSLFRAFENVDCTKRIFEIGFGMGYATAEFAAAHPEVCLLGSEVYPPGVGKLLSEIERLELENVRIVREDAVDVVTTGIGDGELDGVHIFFPDPWPKKRHHKRRLVKPEFVTILTRKLKQEGYLYITTDWEEYATRIADVLFGAEELRNGDPLPASPRFSRPQSWRPRTAFERKGLSKGHLVREFYYVRRTPE